MTSHKLFMLGLAATLANVMSASGCTLLWLFNNDPEGLPCDFSESKAGGCLDGYTCVGGLCMAAAEKVIGDPCARSEECARGLACAVPDGFRSCEDDGDDVNCALLDEDDLELRCRQSCETVDDTSCASGERCWLLSDVEGVPGVCAKGTCATDTECRTIDGSDAICGGAFEAGTSGLCEETCAPLSCRVNDTCAGCDGLDNVVGDAELGFNCAPQAGTAVQDFRYVCTASGSTPDFAACGGPTDDLCRFGAFCIGFTDGTAACVPWCASGGGNPACPQGSACQDIDGTLGFCVPQ
jgi:hypothetical protein